MASILDLLVAMKDGVQAIRSLETTIQNTFPPITTLSTTTPSAGTLAYSSSLAEAFGLVQTSSGGTYRIALLPSS